MSFTKNVKIWGDFTSVISRVNKKDEFFKQSMVTVGALVEKGDDVSVVADHWWSSVFK